MALKSMQLGPFGRESELGVHFAATREDRNTSKHTLTHIAMHEFMLCSGTASSLQGALLKYFCFKEAVRPEKVSHF